MREVGARPAQGTLWYSSDSQSGGHTRKPESLPESQRLQSGGQWFLQSPSQQGTLAKRCESSHLWQPARARRSPWYAQLLSRRPPDACEDLSCHRSSTDNDNPLEGQVTQCSMCSGQSRGAHSRRSVRSLQHRRIGLSRVDIRPSGSVSVVQDRSQTRKEV